VVAHTVLLALGSLGQEDHMLKAKLGYIMRSCLKNIYTYIYTDREIYGINAKWRRPRNIHKQI
jgi:hypothetical protein